MILHIVIPCYNEQEVLQDTFKQLDVLCADLENQQKVDKAYLVLVDDGSKDNTWSIVEELSQKSPRVVGLKLSHNEGHQNALWAGLEWSSTRCDAAISIDADLQDDIQAICKMVDAWRSGYDVVYGVRNQRKTDTAFKRFTALGFYKMTIAMGVDLVYNHADFRLMSARALVALLSYPERNVFLRGIVPQIGYPSTKVYYDRGARMAGESKYPLSKMLSFAIDGITSFSVKPLTAIVSMGLCFVVLSLLAIVYAVVAYFMGRTIPGWTSILISLWFIGGVTLFSMGVVGTYIGKIYMEVKRRPRYFIEKVVQLSNITITD